jgi:hypothetical protein
VTSQYNILVPDLSHQPASEIVLDGEIIAMDEKGKQCCTFAELFETAGGRTEHRTAVSRLLCFRYPLPEWLRLGLSVEFMEKLLVGCWAIGRVRLVEYFEKDGELVYKAL